jgi:hemoglobin
MPRPRDPKVPPHRYADPLSLVKPELKKLYERAGGEQGLAEILRDFYARMSRDVLVGFFFDGKDVDKIALTQKAFLMRAFGAAPSYAGKAPADAHADLAPILRGHFDRRLQILEETLRDHGLSDEDIRTWVGFENAFRDQIVAKT